jgi:hypothetical protein
MEARTPGCAAPATPSRSSWWNLKELVGKEGKKMAKKRGNGEGTIYRRPDGRWCTQITVYVNGKRKRPTLYGKTRKEVADKLAKVTAA